MEYGGSYVPGLGPPIDACGIGERSTIVGNFAHRSARIEQMSGRTESLIRNAVERYAFPISLEFFAEADELGDVALMDQRRRAIIERFVEMGAPREELHVSFARISVQSGSVQRQILLDVRMAQISCGVRLQRERREWFRAHCLPVSRLLISALCRTELDGLPN